MKLVLTTVLENKAGQSHTAFFPLFVPIDNLTIKVVRISVGDHDWHHRPQFAFWT